MKKTDLKPGMRVRVIDGDYLGCQGRVSELGHTSAKTWVVLDSAPGDNFTAHVPLWSSNLEEISAVDRLAELVDDAGTTEA